MRSPDQLPVMTPQAEAGLSPLGCAFSIGQRIVAELRTNCPDAVIVFGGDTAFRILSALGQPLLRPIGEILPGVPVSRIDGYRTLMITKAGGFGEPGLLEQLEKKLNG